jgi:hypothetical protein
MNKSKGRPYNAQWVVRRRPDLVADDVTRTAASCDGYSFQVTTPICAVLTRKYRPKWWTPRETETMTVTVTEGPFGTSGPSLK